MGHKKKEIQHNKDNLQVKSEERSQDDRCTSDTAWPGQSGAAAQVTGVWTAVNTRCFLLLDPLSNSRREFPGELAQILTWACLSQCADKVPILHSPPYPQKYSAWTYF